jgi:hypothetical protein
MKTGWRGLWRGRGLVESRADSVDMSSSVEPELAKEEREEGEQEVDSCFFRGENRFFDKDLKRRRCSSLHSNACIILPCAVEQKSNVKPRKDDLNAFSYSSQPSPLYHIDYPPPASAV